MFSGYDQDDPAFAHYHGIPIDAIFREAYECQPITAMPKASAAMLSQFDYGGKLILPQSALERLSRLNIVYPMLFEVENRQTNRRTNCGVLEFSAHEGIVHMPVWMMKTIGVVAGDRVGVENVTLKVGSYIKIQPQSVDFLDITDPRAVLEHALRHFATLTVGDIVSIYYNHKVYDLLVLETKPVDERFQGISVLETDLQVEFAAPLGYEEPSTRASVTSNGGDVQSSSGGYKSALASAAVAGKKSLASSLDVNVGSYTATGPLSASLTSSTPSMTAFAAFSGTGHRLTTRPASGSTTVDPPSSDTPSGGSIDEDGKSGVPIPAGSPTGRLAVGSKRNDHVPPALNLPPGTLYFGAPHNTANRAGGKDSSGGTANPTGSGSSNSSSMVSSSGGGSMSSSGAAFKPFSGQGRKLT